jgi:hypothetical protein
METVFLVSSIDLIDADTESIYLQQEFTKRGYKTTIECWDDPDVKWENAARAVNNFFNVP